LESSSQENTSQKGEVSTAENKESASLETPEGMGLKDIEAALNRVERLGLRYAKTMNLTRGIFKAFRTSFHELIHKVLDVLGFSERFDDMFDTLDVWR
jgi:hypothetical protein